MDIDDGSGGYGSEASEHLSPLRPLCRSRPRVPSPTPSTAPSTPDRYHGAACRGGLDSETECEAEGGSGVAPAPSSLSTVVKLNVGGVPFTTTVGTLLQHPNTYFCAMFSGRLPTTVDDERCIFIDRDGKRFRHVLNFLRSGDVHLRPDQIDVCKALIEEADFFQIEELKNLLTSRLKELHEYWYPETNRAPPTTHKGNFPFTLDDDF